MSYYGINYFNEFFTGGRKLGSHFMAKVLEGIKRLSGYKKTPISSLSSSDLEWAFQYLGGVEMNLTNSRQMRILILSFMGFLRFSELLNLKRSDFILQNTHMSIFIEKSKTDIYRKIHCLNLAKEDWETLKLHNCQRSRSRPSSQYRFRSQEIWAS